MTVEDDLRAFYSRELRDRADRPLGEDRERRLQAFIETCAAEGRRHVVEVGCGAGRDGRVMAEAGLEYTGVDLSHTGVEICRKLGLAAHEASAAQLPLPSNSYDAGWSMSTLMHLPDPGMEHALAELGRVVKSDGILEVGVWGGTKDGERVDSHGRYFRQRTDEELRARLSTIGEVVAFDTWQWFDDGGHYQWARLRIL
jgi:SAM-dependent methyltransferase